MSEAGVLSEDGAGREDPGPAPRKGRGPVSALPAHYRPIRPGLAGANGTHWVRAAGAREAPAPRGAVMKMIRLRRRLRRPCPRDAAASARALRAQGRPGPGPDGTGPMGGQDETGPHRGGVRYSSGGAPSAARRGEPAGRPGPCTHPSKKSPAPIIPAGVRILTRRTAHRTLADLPHQARARRLRGRCAHPPARGPPGARSATSTTSPSGEYSAGAPQRRPRPDKRTVNRRFPPGRRIRDDGIEFFRACAGPP